MSTTIIEKSLTIMVPTENVFPNPLNPRKNDSIDSEEITSIINKHGWQEPLTGYRKSDDSDIYILLAGHRRLYAAKQAQAPEVPIYVVNKPASITEEIERIGSLQSGRVNWTAYEWASYTYNLWLEWGKPARGQFAKDLNLKEKSVKDYINVMQFFPRNEIEDGLTKKELTVSTLASLTTWMRALSREKPKLYEGLGEDLIRRTMIEKIANKKADRHSLRKTDYCKLVAEADIKKFLTDKEMDLEYHINYLGLDRKYGDFKGHKISMSHIQNRIPHVKPVNLVQQEEAVGFISDTIELLTKQLEEIKNMTFKN